MSLKSLIQWLLDSRTTPEEAGHNAMPINIANATNLTMDVGAEGSYTAPADGYLSLMVEPGGNINLWGQILPISSFPIQNVQGKLFVPMAKGMEVRYYINGTVSLAKFLKTIGGGYNRFVRRDLSCLRALSNCLPKVFLRAKNSGLAVKHSLKQLLHWMFRHVPSLHRLMGILDTSTLSAVEANSCSIWIRVKKYLAVKSLVIAGFLQQIPTARQQYLSRKAVLLLLLPMRCSIKFGLLRLQARHNLRTGGALC